MNSLDTAETLAKFLNVSVACVRKYTRLSDMPRVRIGHAVRFDRAEVLAWLKERQQKKQPVALNGAEVSEDDLC